MALPDVSHEPYLLPLNRPHRREPTPPAEPTETVAQRCKWYRSTCLLPVSIEPLSLRIELEVGTVGAISMPAYLGRAVQAGLMSQGMGGPVVAHIRSSTWTIITGPCGITHLNMSLVARLFRMSVTLGGPGTRVTLPSPVDEHCARRHWISKPHNSFLPPADSVIEATLRCGARQ
jgi:hypothetical protein